ncbi:MAG: beta-lactamase family protein [Planctomycetia bacterium]|nr:beta-lactamase family protein [Planctomycetia bacterium]
MCAVLLAVALLCEAAAAPPAPADAARTLDRFDRIIESILRDHHMAGASLAIAKDGRLVLAHGYGWADVRARQPVRADSLFCIASVTKPFTGVAVLRLVEDGRMSLDAKIVDLLADLKPLPGLPVVDPRVRDITVRDLLYHAGGWNRSEDTDGPRDPVRIARRAGIAGPIDASVRWRIAQSERLDFTPGTESHYSNFGFIILRLAIERACGQPYGPFVRQKVLAPMRITRMRIEPVEPNYAPGEVHRYAAGGRRELPGGHDREMGASGGNWIASAADLVRFISALDGTRGKPFLSRDMIAAMLAVPPEPLEVRKNGTHFGLGWDTVREVDGRHRFSKDGGRPGVMAWLEHLPDGIDWAVLYNTSPDEREGARNPMRETRDRVYEALNAIDDWPDTDLFPQLFPK